MMQRNSSGEPQNPIGPADDFKDGNSLAGPLSEIFAIDLTAATYRCAQCGIATPIACLRVYGRVPGLVGRCPSCDEVVLRLVRSPETGWLDLNGVASLTLRIGPV
jgi:hypothetical protein